MCANGCGGTKYVVRGLLLKLCQDPMLPGKGTHLYSGTQQPSFENALKISNLELRGAMLHFPFHAQVCAGGVGVDT